MARIALLSADLLFGSKVQGALEIAGHTVNRFEGGDRIRTAAQFHELLLVDLSAEDLDGPGLVESMREQGELGGAATLGYYTHVDREMRDRARAAGFSVVVPRSRMAREGTSIVERLLSDWRS